MTNLFFTRLLRRAYDALGPLTYRETQHLERYAGLLARRYDRLCAK